MKTLIGILVLCTIICSCSSDSCKDYNGKWAHHLGGLIITIEKKDGNYLLTDRFGTVVCNCKNGLLQIDGEGIAITIDEVDAKDSNDEGRTYSVINMEGDQYISWDDLTDEERKLIE